jgi:2-oxoglutarate decarboxylase
LAEGKFIRFSGQDTRRGTFTQRHSVIIDRKTGEEFTPLDLLTINPDGTPTGGKLEVYDSALSEYAAVGFEYGYSVANPDALVLWEAQFGDFVNGAQSIIDEFISSGEAKWGQLSDVVLLLPHGHEGQGPDHTSGRIERFLQLWAEGSMTIALPSTPANYFHLLRRHGLDGVHRPLIVFTPKSMLRLRGATSEVQDFTTGKFEPVLDDARFAGPANANGADPVSVRRILLHAGKLHYDLIAELEKMTPADQSAFALVRLEQYYPLPVEELNAVLRRYPNAEVMWVQDEPENQGAWPFISLELVKYLEGRTVRVVARPASASPATGSSKVSAAQQTALIEQALAL